MDLALLTGAIIINEDLGDDMDLIQPEHLGSCLKATTDDSETIIQVGETTEEVQSLIDQIKEELEGKLNPGEVIRLEKRLARLSAKV
jgi:chaperonin GroEL